jgi:hypothetical protein
MRAPLTRTRLSRSNRSCAETSREVNGFLSFILDADATDLLISAVGSHIKRLGIDY